MPVLARTIEAAGISTVVVTMMPFFSEKAGVPRTVGVEFPFGHSFGMPNDREMQMAVVRAALEVLATTKAPGEVRHLDIEWPQPHEVAYRDWHPPEPSPIVAAMRERRRREAEEQQRAQQA